MVILCLTSSFQGIYYGTIGVLILLVVILCFVRDTRMTCEGSLFTWHWFAVSAIDIFQSVLIFFSAGPILRALKQARDEERRLMGQLSSNEH